MRYKVVLLQYAEQDLRALKNYVVKNFSVKTWQSSYSKIKESVNSLKTFPQAASIPPELAELSLSQYRQIISGMNRIIYEIRQKTIYIHVICDTRKDLKSLLTRRLLDISYT